MKFEKTEVHGFTAAFRGMRNPLNSWHKSDSIVCREIDCKECAYTDNCKIMKNGYCVPFVPGKNDLILAQRLIKAGSEHRKFMRQIMVWVDITAPLFWWRQFDTYKVGTTTNSTSTMHKLSTTPITKECFEHPELVWDCVIDMCEKQRQKYLETKDKKDWKKLIVCLPESWLQKRTVTMSYENILNIVNHRKHHKLSEWSEDFINWAKSLPYSEELLFIEGDKKHEASF